MYVRHSMVSTSINQSGNDLEDHEGEKSQAHGSKPDSLGSMRQDGVSLTRSTVCSQQRRFSTLEQNLPSFRRWSPRRRKPAMPTASQRPYNARGPGIYCEHRRHDGQY